MTRPLIALGDHLAPLLATISPVAPVRLPWRDAVGLVAAEDVAAPSALPPAAVALRSGFAVNALDCAGAAPQSPAPLPAMPMQVSSGDVLPAGCDAILDPAALQAGRFGPETLEAVEPGTWVRLAGQDLAAGEPIVASGERVSPEQALGAAWAGMTTVAVRHPAVRLDWQEGPERDWLARRLERCGMRIPDTGAEAHLIIGPAGDDRPVLALAPGGAAWAEHADGIIRLSLPPRFDALVGAWCAIALPILARLSGADLASRPATLTGKIASAVGWSEVVLLRMEGDHAHPLAVGDAPLNRILRADGFAIIDPVSEGAPSGSTIMVISLDRPF